MTIFNAPKVAEHLNEVKAKAPEDTAWWQAGPVLEFDWKDVRKTQGSATSWASIWYTDSVGVRGRLVIRILGEVHTGQIMPITDVALAKLIAESKPNPNVQYKKRDKKPSFQVRKWRVQVKTADDGVTLLVDEDGKPIVPDDKYLSPYFQVASLVGEAYLWEVNERLERGKALLTAIQAAKKVDKTATASAIFEEFTGTHGPARPGCAIITSADSGNIRKLFPQPKDYNMLVQGVIVVASDHVAPLIQELLSSNNSKNAGALLPNPITRVALNFDKDTGLPNRLSFFDKTKPFQAEGKKGYDIGKVDDVPINAENVHEFITPGVTVDGIVNMDSMCFSNMGVSIPVKLEVAVVMPRADRSITLDDVYGEEDEGGDAGEGSGSFPPDPPAPAQPAPAQPAPAQPAPRGAGPVESEDMDDLLNDLSGANITG